MKKEGYQLSADEVLNANFEVVQLAGRNYTIYPPTIKTLARMVSCIEKVEIKENESVEMLNDIVKSNANSTQYLTYAILGNRVNGVFGKLRFWWVHKQIMNANSKELKNALLKVRNLIGLEDFFACAVLTWTATKITQQEETEHSTDK